MTATERSSRQRNSARTSANVAESRTTTRRPAPPQRSVPDDSLFKASFQRLNDAQASEVDRRFAALAALPTPVQAEECTRMWIPAGRLTAEHNIGEILTSLASDSQPATWRESRAHLRDFVRIPNQGISFTCTSDTALQRLGGVELMICDTKVTIRKYSSYDKLYFVDLVRLPTDLPDQAIYDWFMSRGARPILITPTQVHGGLKSRARTVYFNSVQCPAELIEPGGDPLREIYFIDGDKPCFVQHRLRRYNRVKPPSLQPPPRRGSSASDESMRSNDDATANQDTPAPSTLPQPDSPSQPESQRSSPPSESAGVSSPSDSASTTSPQKYATPSSKPGGSRVTEAKASRMILGSVGKDEPEWKWVQHSQYGVINRGGPKFIEPDNAQPCELSAASTDPHALIYSIPVMPNTYDVLQDDGFDLSLPPDVDIEAAMIDEDGIKTIVSGFSAGSDLVPHEADARHLKDVRKIPLKVEQLSVEELQQAIDAFLVTEVLAFTSHEDVVAAVQAQPAYFRRIFKLPTEQQDRLLKAHAIYRMVNAEPLANDESTDVMERVRCRCDVDPVDTDAVFTHLFQDEQRQQAAIHSAISDLFLMIFAPGLYIDPVKVQALLPPKCPPKRLRYSPFLLWSDFNLLHLARTDVGKIFLDDDRTPPHVKTALRHLSSEDLPPAVEAGPSRLVHPQL